MVFEIEVDMFISFVGNGVDLGVVIEVVGIFVFEMQWCVLDDGFFDELVVFVFYVFFVGYDVFFFLWLVRLCLVFDVQEIYGVVVSFI